MKITNDDHKPSLDPDALEHYGIKGMKWGVRRSDEQLARARGKKVTTTEIKDARARVASKDRQIKRQIDVVNLAESGKKQAEEYLKLEKMALDDLKSPDRDTALRMTTGEKAATAAIAVGVPGVGTAVSAGMIAGLAVQRSELKKQRRKAGV